MATGYHEFVLTAETIERAAKGILSKPRPVMAPVYDFSMSPVGFPKVIFGSYPAMVKTWPVPPVREWEDEQRVKVEAVLRRALALLRQGWTKGALADDGVGTVRDWFDEDARRWCLVGAVRRGCYDLSQGALETFCERALAEDDFVPGGGSLSRFNDRQEDAAPVIALIERTIRRVAVPK